MDKKVLLNVDGMDCASCASTITRTLTRDGFKDVNVDFLSGEVTFEKSEAEAISKAIVAIHRLGYSVKARSDNGQYEIAGNSSVVNDTLVKFLICLFFTIPLLLHMFMKIPLFHQPLFQLLFCIPVLIIGLFHFGKSAFYSLRSGVPNMDVLIFTGSTAAFVYSLAGYIKYGNSTEVHQYLFFETAATIITLVLLGNLIEQRSVKQTTNALGQLARLQPSIAMKIVVEDGNETIIETKIEDLKKDDIVKINSGDKVPLDGKIIYGKGLFDESMITGESQPVLKTINDTVTGGTVMEDGNARVEIEKTGNDTALAKIIELVRKAQHSKPEIQKLGDKISAIFVPVVLGISFLTFLISVFVLNVTVPNALMRSIAVLVISCPCAMGLATPTAVMVGLGRAARNGILIKGGSTIELLAGIKTFVFDKTGTLTTGNFKINNIRCFDTDEITVKEILYELEKNSSHPIARSLQNELRIHSSSNYKWKTIGEDKGIGINATDSEGNIYSAGSFQMVKHFYNDLSHDVYLLKNNKLIATVDLQDEIKENVANVVRQLKQNGIRVIMLSGDTKKNCEKVAELTGIKEIYYEKLPSEKLKILEGLNKENPTAMFGDGINDAPALSLATVGISIADATDIAVDSSQIILLDKHDLAVLLRAMHISKLTYQTIRQNLFWAFFYNVVAIPIAAAGFLSPMIGALSMAFSDVIVIGNSLRLRIRKI